MTDTKTKTAPSVFNILRVAMAIEDAPEDQTGEAFRNHLMKEVGDVTIDEFKAGGLLRAIAGNIADAP